MFVDITGARLVRKAGRYAWPAAAVFLAVSCAWAQPPSLTLDAALRMALARAPLMEARREQLSAAQEEQARAGAPPDPQAFVGLDNFATQGPGAYTAGGDSMTMRTFGLSQVLPSPGKRRAERSVGAANVEMAASAQTATAAGLRQQVAEAWIMGWGARQEQAMLEVLKAAREQDVAVAEARLRGGTGGAADVLAARLEVVELANSIDEAAAQERQARARLARWLGGAVDGPWGDAPDFNVLPAGQDALLAQLDREGPLLDWPAREHAAEAALDEARADRLPQWSVGVSYGSRVRGLPDLLSVQLGVSLPLFPHNRQDRGISARAAELAAVRAEHEDARRQQIEQVQSAWALWQGLSLQVQRHREVLLPLASDRSALALAAYRGGGDIQPLLQARRDELTHHLELVRTQAELGRAWAALAYLLPESEP